MNFIKKQTEIWTYTKKNNYNYKQKYINFRLDMNYPCSNWCIML